jgi:hypothetical protein
MIKWNVERDSFEYGQWFKGRVYERRCDLSPEGDMLLYFAASFRKPYYSWSAVSRPPFFTALALWPKGDCWGGGGHFLSRNHIALNHRDGEMNLAQDFSIAERMSLTQFGEYSGRGEDDPIWSTRLQRDGWKLIRSPERLKDDYGAKVLYEFDPPITWQKPHPLIPETWTLQMEVLGLMEKNGPWYLIDHAILGKDGEIWNIGRSDWADWSHEGDLLFAQSGCLFRLPWKDRVFGAIEESRQIADFSKLAFEPREAPEHAHRWPDQ